MYNRTMAEVAVLAACLWTGTEWWKVAIEGTITQDAPEVYSYNVQWESLDVPVQINVPVHPGLVVRRAVSPEQLPAVLQLVSAPGWHDLYQVLAPTNRQILSIHYCQPDNPPQLPSTPVQQQQQQPPARPQQSRPDLLRYRDSSLWSPSHSSQVRLSVRCPACTSQ